MPAATLTSTRDDEAFLAGRKIDQSLHARILVERAIVRRCAQALIDAGYYVSVDCSGERGYDREAMELIDSRDLHAIMDAVMAGDDDYLFVSAEPLAAKPKEPFDAYVSLVYGNDGWDVISDYQTNLEAVLKPVNDFADTLSEGVTVFRVPAEVWELLEGVKDVMTMSDPRSPQYNDSCADVVQALFELESPLDALLYGRESLTRRFYAVWGAGYEAPRADGDLHVGFFSDGNGYDAAAARKILALNVGETADLCDLSGEHWVTRMPETPSQLAEKGYRIEFGTADHPTPEERGRYWWTWARGSGSDVSGEDWTTAEGAIADALQDLAVTGGGDDVDMADRIQAAEQARGA
jgi:hypothetical protein